MAGEWRIRIRAELPFPAELPRVGHDELGLRNLSTRAGGGQQTEVTMLDTSDHRLVRAGVLLAHRISDGIGDWYLSTPDWRGLDDKVAPLDDEGDLPAEFREVIAAYRRLGTLGPSAALTVERQDYLIRGTQPATSSPGTAEPDGTAAASAEVDQLGTLRDDRVTVRRNGLTMARFREVTITMTSRRMGQAQVAWLEESLRIAGGTVVSAFPALAQRLGAPATGPTDFPDPEDIPTVQLTDLVSRWIAAGLRGMIAQPDGVAAAELARRLSAIGPALERPWSDDLVTDLQWIASLGGNCPDDTPGTLQSDGERALALIDSLVTAVRAPRTVEDWPTDSAAALSRLRQEAEDEVRDVVTELTDDAGWEEARRRVARARDLSVVAAEDRIGGKRGRHRRRARRFGALHDQLQSCIDAELPHLLADLGALSAEQAFELGREYERRTAALTRRRETVIADWGAIVDRASA